MKEHGGLLTRLMGPTILIVCLYSLTRGGVFEALGCLPATALMAAKLALDCNSSQEAVGGFHPSAARA